jgi:hypothetical protein
MSLSAGMMGRIENKRGGAGRAALLAGVLALVCLSLVLSAVPAWGAFEQVGCFAGTGVEQCGKVQFEDFGEEVQLGGLGGMAVNYTGAGGVPKGTVYAAGWTLAQGTAGVVMFEPVPGGLRFEETWKVASEAGESYSRCGPLLGLNGEGKPEHPCTTRVNQPSQAMDVDVDQATGEVFVYDGLLTEAGRKVIVAYNADGSEEVTRFGERAPGSETISESPAKVHHSPLEGALAVNGAGDVYLFDQDDAEDHRLMEFRPDGSGGYEYVVGGDVGSGNPHRPSLPVADAAGHLYVASDSTYIEEYNPAFPSSPPVCTFRFGQGGITAVTVDPLTGNVFFYSYRVAAGSKGKTVHELGPCDEMTGRFEGPGGAAEVGQVEVLPERAELTGLAFDPQREFEAGRPVGTLYGGAPGGAPPLGLSVGEPGQSSLGYTFALTKESKPVVSGERVSRVRTSSAGLSAMVDPKAFDTSYAFQYETETEYSEDGGSFVGAREAPVNGAILKGGSGLQAVGVTLTGLIPGMEYRFRVVAGNHGCPSEHVEELCITEGEVERFRTFAAGVAGLPDGRGYELVSPAQKDGGQVLPGEPRVSSCGSESECKPGGHLGRYPSLSAPDGNTVAFEGTAFGPGAGLLENEYVARRDPDGGWQTVTPTPELLYSRGAKGAGYDMFSVDLGEAVLAQEQLQPPLAPGAPGEYEDLYAQSTVSPFTLDPVLDQAPPGREVDEFKVRFAGASADLSRVFFAANAALPVTGAPVAVDGGPAEFNLYEWERASGVLRLVNVAPDGSTEPGAVFGAGSAHAISEDGKRAFFSDQAGQVFVREDADRSREIPGSGPGAGFLAAAAGDGSRVLLSNGVLYDLESEESTDLSEDQEHVHKGGFLGLVGQSEDLSHLYFIDSEVLTGGEESCREPVLAGAAICETALSGKENLYSWDEGTTRFVATLAAGDGGGGSLDLAHDWASVPSDRTAEASPDGRYVAFLSQAPLTGFDSTGPCEANHAGGYVPALCPEVFLYDSQTGRLTCTSCNQTGAAPLGWSVLRLFYNAGEWLPQARYLTDSGRLFFDSQDSLSPQDINEGAEDVYEYEPSGTGSCTGTNGCVSLISSGSEGTDSNFLAANPSGSDVFFTTRDRLVSADTDQLIDLYDAREPHHPGETVGSPEALGSGSCQGEDCQSSSSTAPTPAAPPASAILTGPGNSTPPAVGGGSKPSVVVKACPRGKVRQHEKCVERPKKKPKAHSRQKRGKRRQAKHSPGRNGR